MTAKTMYTPGIVNNYTVIFYANYLFRTRPNAGFTAIAIIKIYLRIKKNELFGYINNRFGNIPFN